MNSKNIKRGEIYYATLGKTVGSVQGGIRPVVILQNDVGNGCSPTVIIATITSKANKKRNMPTHVAFQMEGLAKESIVQLEQITTIDKQQILNYVGTIPETVMQKIEKAIKISLSMK